MDNGRELENSSKTFVPTKPRTHVATRATCMKVHSRLFSARGKLARNPFRGGGHERSFRSAPHDDAASADAISAIFQRPLISRSKDPSLGFSVRRTWEKVASVAIRNRGDQRRIYLGRADKFRRNFTLRPTTINYTRGFFFFTPRRERVPGAFRQSLAQSNRAIFSGCNRRPEGGREVETLF